MELNILDKNGLNLFLSELKEYINDSIKIKGYHFMDTDDEEAMLLYSLNNPGILTIIPENILE